MIVTTTSSNVKCQCRLQLHLRNSAGNMHIPRSRSHRTLFAAHSVMHLEKTMTQWTRHGTVWSDTAVDPKASNEEDENRLLGFRFGGCFFAKLLMR